MISAQQEEPPSLNSRSSAGAGRYPGPHLLFPSPLVTVFVTTPPTIVLVMIHFFEQLIAMIWNRLRRRGGEARQESGTLGLGFHVVDGQVTSRQLTLSNTRRAMHTAVLGKTGTGKSSLLRAM